MATEGYYLNTIIDVTTTILDWTAEAINDLRDMLDEIVPGQEEGQPKEDYAEL